MDFQTISLTSNDITSAAGVVISAATTTVSEFRYFKFYTPTTIAQDITADVSYTAHADCALLNSINNAIQVSLTSDTCGCESGFGTCEATGKCTCSIGNEGTYCQLTTV